MAKDEFNMFPKTLNINVSGTTFIVNAEVINKNSESPLMALTRDSPYYDVTNDAFCFSRDPDVFYSVLNFYRYGELHLPRFLCSNMMRKELEFWGIKENEQPFQYEEMTSSVTLRAKIWKILENTDNSLTSKIWSRLYVCIILLHTCVFLIWNEKVVRNSPSTTDIYNQNWTRFVEIDPALILLVVSILCNSFFTCELVVHFIVCPMKKTFMCSVWNILNILLTLDCWFVIITVACVDLSNQNQHFQKVVLFYTSLNNVRFLTILKNLSGASPMKELLFVARNNLTGILELLLVYLIGVIIFGTLIYYAETSRQEFNSDIWNTLLWTASMKSHGLEDNQPRSFVGKMLSTVAILYNVLLFAATVAFITSRYICHVNDEKKRHNELRKWR